MTSKSTKERLRLFGAAILFLCNPHVSAVDILPDAVAMLIFLQIFSPLRHTSVHMQSALQKFTHCFVYSLLRIPATVLLFFLYSRYPTQNTLFPLFSLSFAILDGILLIPALLALLRAFSALSQEKTTFGDGFDKKIAVAIKLSPLFIILRGVIPFLPDLLMLTDDAAGLSLVGYYPIAAFLALLPSLIVALFIYSTFNALRPHLIQTADTLDDLAKPFQALIKTEQKIFHLTFAWVCVILSAIAPLDLQFSGVDCFPDTLSPLFLILAFFLFRQTKSFSFPPRLTYLLFISLLTNIIADIAYARFFGNYDHRDIYYSPSVEKDYFIVLFLFLFKILADVLVFIALYRPLVFFATEETGNYIEQSPIHRQQDLNRRALARIIKIFTVSGIIACFIETLIRFCSLYPISYEASKENVANGEVILPLFDFLGPLFFIFALLRFAYMIWGGAHLIEEVKEKYRER